MYTIVTFHSMTANNCLFSACCNIFAHFDVTVYYK